MVRPTRAASQGKSYAEDNTRDKNVYSPRPSRSRASKTDSKSYKEPSSDSEDEPKDGDEPQQDVEENGENMEGMPQGEDENETSFKNESSGEEEFGAPPKRSAGKRAASEIEPSPAGDDEDDEESPPKQQKNTEKKKSGKAAASGPMMGFAVKSERFANIDRSLDRLSGGSSSSSDKGKGKRRQPSRSSKEAAAAKASEPQDQDGDSSPSSEHEGAGSDDPEADPEASEEASEEASVSDDDEAYEEEEKPKPRRRKPKTRGRRGSSSSEARSPPRRSSRNSGRAAGDLAEPMDVDSDESEDSDTMFVPSTGGGGKGKQPAKGGKGKAKTVPKARKSKAEREAEEELEDNADLIMSSEEDRDSAKEDNGEEGDDEPLNIGRVLASKTQSAAEWEKEMSIMQTKDVTNGSMWFQEETPPDADKSKKHTKYLVKWQNKSFLHVSWETEKDLVDLLGSSAKRALKRYAQLEEFNPAQLEELRGDGKYFDPTFIEPERALDFDEVEGEESRLLIKWAGLPYSDSTYEYLSDLEKCGVDYETMLDAYKKAEETAKRVATSPTISPAKAGEPPKLEFINGGSLRDYQELGVKWMLSNWLQKRSSILADEMGLGKTLQTAAFIMTLHTHYKKKKPFLVVAPLSTVAHWQREIQGWTGMNTIVLHGSQEDRALIEQYELYLEEEGEVKAASGKRKGKGKKRTSKTSNKKVFKPVVIVTTPEMIIREDVMRVLVPIQFEVLIVDEAHRLKNDSSRLTATLNKDIGRYSWDRCLLLTGTPLQNNTEELWTLLNFVDGHTFEDKAEFVGEYGDVSNVSQVEALQKAIRPYVLRRMKEDVEKALAPKEETIVEVELSILQKQYYRAIIEKNTSFLCRASATGKKRPNSDKPTLMNLAMELRKCCNHPYLIKGAESDITAMSGGAHKNIADALADCSGKLMLLDKLLPKLKAQGHRVLIFSQFRIMLDIIEDYLDGRNYIHGRIDGCITGATRQKTIDKFQAPDSDVFIMMLSTRAGGVGINLTSADTVIIYDSDWNPQNDLQAQARCHRIGQTKSVKVYRLLTRKTYEQVMFQSAGKKLGLDRAVLSKSGVDGATSGGENISAGTLELLLRKGAYEVFAEEGENEKASKNFCEADIDSILARSEVIVHDGASGGAINSSNKATFTSGDGQEVDLNDPDFWTKAVGLSMPDETEEQLFAADRAARRGAKSYKESSSGKLYQEQSQDSDFSDKGGGRSDESGDEGNTVPERGLKSGKDKARRVEQWDSPDIWELWNAILKWGSNRFDKIRDELKGAVSQTEVERVSRGVIAVVILHAIRELTDESVAKKLTHKQTAHKEAVERAAATNAFLAANSDGDVLCAPAVPIPEAPTALSQEEKDICHKEVVEKVLVKFPKARQMADDAKKLLPDDERPSSDDRILELLTMVASTAPPKASNGFFTPRVKKPLQKLGLVDDIDTAFELLQLVEEEHAGDGDDTTDDESKVPSTDANGGGSSNSKGKKNTGAMYKRLSSAIPLSHAGKPADWWKPELDAFLLKAMGKYGWLSNGKACTKAEEDSELNWAGIRPYVQVQVAIEAEPLSAKTEGDEHIAMNVDGEVKVESEPEVKLELVELPVHTALIKRLKALIVAFRKSQNQKPKKQNEWLSTTRVASPKPKFTGGSGVSGHFASPSAGGSSTDVKNPKKSTTPKSNIPSLNLIKSVLKSPEIDVLTNMGMPRDMLKEDVGTKRIDGGTDVDDELVKALEWSWQSIGVRLGNITAEAAKEACIQAVRKLCARVPSLTVPLNLPTEPVLPAPAALPVVKASHSLEEKAEIIETIKQMNAEEKEAKDALAHIVAATQARALLSLCKSVKCVLGLASRLLETSEKATLQKSPKSATLWWLGEVHHGALLVGTAVCGGKAGLSAALEDTTFKRAMERAGDNRSAILPFKLYDFKRSCAKDRLTALRKALPHAVTRMMRAARLDNLKNAPAADNTNDTNAGGGSSSSTGNSQKSSPLKRSASFGSTGASPSKKATSPSKLKSSTSMSSPSKNTSGKSKLKLGGGSKPITSFFHTAEVPAPKASASADVIDISD